MRRGPIYRTPQPSGGTGSRVSHFAAHMPPEMQPPASTLDQEVITISAFVLVEGGSGGIRTPGAFRHARFQGPRSDVREQSGGMLPLVTTKYRCSPDSGERR
jgi:hypothetical protein